MKMQLEQSSQMLISNYAIGVLAIDGVEYRNNLIVTPTRVIEDWFTGDDPADLRLEHFAPLLGEAGTQAQAQPRTEPQTQAEKPEIVLLGTGAEHRFPPFQLMAELRRYGIALEVMETRAACRTYSVLISEYRPVVAALIQLRA